MYHFPECFLLLKKISAFFQTPVIDFIATGPLSAPMEVSEFKTALFDDGVLLGVHFQLAYDHHHQLIGTKEPKFGPLVGRKRMHVPGIGFGGVESIDRSRGICRGSSGREGQPRGRHMRLGRTWLWLYMCVTMLRAVGIHDAISQLETGEVTGESCFEEAVNEGGWSNDVYWSQ